MHREPLLKHKFQNNNREIRIRLKNPFKSGLTSGVVGGVDHGEVSTASDPDGGDVQKGNSAVVSNCTQ